MDIVKRILVAGLFLGGVLCANATVRYMTVEHKSGKKCSFLLDDNPVVTYSDGNLVVNGSATTSYAISDVKDFHFTVGDESGVKNIESDLLRIINVDDKTIRIENAPVNIEVMMMNINGILVCTTLTDSNGIAVLTLPEHKGLYVLSVGMQSIKLIRK